MARTTDIEKSTPSVSSSSPSVASIPVIGNDHIVPFIPATLTVSSLQYEITVKEQPKDGEKKSLFKKVPNVQKALLSNISAKAMPGRVLAIMGPSGSGKTTLLDLLADRQARNLGKIQGEILLNDVPVKEYGSIRKRLVGYDTKVGGAVIRGISGGEKRRVTIGIELLSSPSVLLLDEPTSGLSSTDALNVANAIKELSRKGRTVILTVHQPRSDIYELFDDLLLLSQGKVVYFGRAHSAASYFESLGHECPVGWNVADYFLDLITLHQETGSSEDFAKKYSDYLGTNPEAYLTQLLKEHQNTSEKLERNALLDKYKKEYTTEYATTTLTQTMLLTQRSLTNLARHPTIFQASVVIHIIFALVVGSLFSGLKDRPEMGATSFNKSIALFFITSFLATMTFSAMPQFIIERSLFLRERGAGMYRTSSYFMAKTIVETLSYTILSVVFVVIVYFLIGLKGSILYYFVSVAVFVNVALSLIAAIGAGAENAEVGMNILSLVNTMAMLFSGFIVSRTDIPRGWIWAFWGSYYQWAFSGLLGNEFSDHSEKGNATLAYFGMIDVDWLTKWRAVLVLLGYYILFRILGLLLLLAKRA
ncbi:hypothetical protein KVV02_008628 [Mortierella alpina]|uniref:ABC transporter domain-containing protein n=1 Tax=Mortierella alpina TaxID=64518 RepID=A0A9P8CZK5_MORAP|nr:hypothetical protein KVV02_008628 [Mortierella alpina]